MQALIHPKASLNHIIRCYDDLQKRFPNVNRLDLSRQLYPGTMISNPITEKKLESIQGQWVNVDTINTSSISDDECRYWVTDHHFSISSKDIIEIKE